LPDGSEGHSAGQESLRTGDTTVRGNGNALASAERLSGFIDNLTGEKG